MKYMKLKKKVSLLKCKGLILLLFLSFPSVCFGALASTTVWEVRVASIHTNGSGFNASNASVGTDFSQQAAAQDSGTDLASADGDAVPCVVTSATHNFVAADNGNLINIFETGDGFTVGYYEIVSTVGNAATLDRACGTDGAKTGGDWAYGGATGHPEDIDQAVVTGNIIYIEAGTYQDDDADNEIINPVNASGGRIWWKGYKTSRNDYPTGTDRPVLDGNSSSTYILRSGTFGHTFMNFIFQNSTSFLVYEYIEGVIFYNVKFLNAGDRAIHSVGDGFVLINCEVDNSSGDGMLEYNTWGSITIRFSYVHDNSGDGVSLGTDGAVGSVINSVFDTNGGDGIGHTAASRYSPQIFNSVFFNNTNDGLYLHGDSATSPVMVMSSIFQDNGQEGIDCDKTTNLSLVDWNIYYSNTGGTISGLQGGENDLGNVDPKFTTPLSGDFTLQSGSPALDAGLQPGTDSGLTGDYKWNVGVDQDDVAAAGGSVTTGYSSMR